MRSIDVDDINILEVQAFDHEGNVFSTLEGLKFQWRIEENPQSLRIIPIKEAHFKTSKKKLEMEKKRLMTDISLLKGLKTGISVVSVQLIEEDHEEVQKANITLSVIEPFTLDPSYPVYISPNSEFQFGILKIKTDHKYSRVALPSNDYKFLSGDIEKGIIKNNGLFLSNNKLGPVTVTAEDTAIVSNKAQGLVHIVPPDQLEIELYDITENINRKGLDEYASVIYGIDGDKEVENVKKDNLMVDLHENTWILVEERYYLVNMFLFDQAKHKIELTKNLLFNLDLNKEFLEIYRKENAGPRSAEISNLYIIKTRKVIRETKVVGKLANVKTKGKNIYKFDFERLNVRRGIQITSQVKIVHPTPEIRLPYLGYHKISNQGIEKQLWKLPALGGTGSYKWQSLDEHISLVKSSKSTHSIGNVRGNNEGKTVIRVEDAFNPFNYATIKVFVTKIGSLVWLEERIESAMGGTEDYTHLIAYDEFGRKYTNCSSLIYNLNIRKEDGEILDMHTGSLSWNNTKIFIQENLDLIKLKNRFDDNLDIIYSKDLPKNQEFNEELQFHNNFGI